MSRNQLYMINSSEKNDGKIAIQGGTIKKENRHFSGPHKKN